MNKAASGSNASSVNENECDHPRLKSKLYEWNVGIWIWCLLWMIELSVNQHLASVGCQTISSTYDGKHHEYIIVALETMC